MEGSGEDRSSLPPAAVVLVGSSGKGKTRPALAIDAVLTGALPLMLASDACDRRSHIWR